MDQSILNQISEKCSRIIELVGMKANVAIGEKPEEGIIEVKIEVDDGGILIGYRGQNLQSLQYLLSLMFGEELEGQHMIIDVNRYREENVAQLKKKATEIANQVKTTGIAYDMGFLSPFDRRIVHMVVSEIEGVTTESIGEDRIKKLVIKKEDITK
ncbi:MAG TPA: KH domain-containing protein [Candidatus Dojkabacteria bacterium]|nr:KH domain-containing protein [Candidatus Dojkabacteria bacterium]